MLVNLSPKTLINLQIYEKVIVKTSNLQKWEINATTRSTPPSTPKKFLSSPA